MYNFDFSTFLSAPIYGKFFTNSRAYDIIFQYKKKGQNTMRLDKFLSDAGVCTRSEAKKNAKCGNITVNGEIIRDTSVHIDPEESEIIYCGEKIAYEKFTYIMMNKPTDVLSATEDGSGVTVIDLLPEKYQRIGLFPCGRLDKNTLGLLILTNNGKLAHELLSPAKHVEKTYLFECAEPLSNEDVKTLCSGVDIGEKSSTRPAKVDLISSTKGEITVVEGKFHQIKRMFSAIDNKITYLERISFAGIPLDASLSRGEWRHLTDDERLSLENRN